MTAKKKKIVSVEKNDYKIFLHKAKDFYKIMLKASDIGSSRVKCRSLRNILL